MEFRPDRIRVIRLYGAVGLAGAVGVLSPDAPWYIRLIGAGFAVGGGCLVVLYLTMRVIVGPGEVVVGSAFRTRRYHVGTIVRVQKLRLPVGSPERMLHLRGPAGTSDGISLTRFSDAEKLVAAVRRALR